MSNKSIQESQVGHLYNYEMFIAHYRRMIHFIDNFFKPPETLELWRNQRVEVSISGTRERHRQKKAINNLVEVPETILKDWQYRRTHAWISDARGRAKLIEGKNRPDFWVHVFSDDHGEIYEMEEEARSELTSLLTDPRNNNSDHLIRKVREDLEKIAEGLKRASENISDLEEWRDMKRGVRKEPLMEDEYSTVLNFKGLNDSFFRLKEEFEKLTGEKLAGGPEKESKVLKELIQIGLNDFAKKKGYSPQKVHEVIRGAEDVYHLIAILGELSFRDQLKERTEERTKKAAQARLKVILDEMPGPELSAEEDLKKEFNSINNMGDSYRNRKAPQYSERVRRAFQS